jgi:hypothetical protein
MNKLLSLLLAFVFLQVQTWAHSGGPVYKNNASSYVGTYAGVLIPKGVTVTSSGTASGTTTAAIGLFTMNSPDTGTATGAMVAFVDGAPFIGTIDGLIDPSNGRFRGILSATASYNVVIFVPQTTVTNGVTTTTFTRQTFPVLATGSMDARVRLSGESFVNSNGGSTANRLEGSASLNIFFLLNNDGTPNVSKIAEFSVDGFQQSTTITTTTTFNIGSNNTTNNTGTGTGSTGG